MDIDSAIGVISLDDYKKIESIEIITLSSISENARL